MAEDSEAVARLNARFENGRARALGAIVELRVGEPLAGLDTHQRQAVRRHPRPLS